MLKFSVIIPVHNARDLLRQCLDDVFQSDYPDFECILVNDSSTDDSLSIAQGYPVRILNLVGGPYGPAYARNQAAKIAEGEILFFLDSDVMIKSDTLSSLASAFEAYPEVDAVFGSYDDNPGSDTFLSQYKNLFHHYVHQRGNPEASTFWSGCGAIKRSAFWEMGGFDAERYPRPSIEDIDLGCRMKLQGYRIKLEKDVQVSHHKLWTLKGLLRSEILDRGIPWTRLILEMGELPNDLNLSISQRVSAAALLFGLSVSALGILMNQAFLLPLLMVWTILVISLWGWQRGPLIHGHSDGVFMTAAGLGLFLGVLGTWLDIPSVWLPSLLIVTVLGVGRGIRKIPGGYRQLVYAVILVGLATALGLQLHQLPIVLLALAGFSFLTVILINYSLYSFFRRKKGVLFSIAVVPFHMLYFLYSTTAFLIGLLSYKLNGKLRTSREAVPVPRKRAESLTSQVLPPSARVETE